MGQGAMLVLAWRNLWRHRSRTWIVGSAIALSYALFLVVISIEDYSHVEMRAKAERMVGGALRVEGEGFTATRALEHRVPGGEALARRLAEMPEVVATRPVVELSALLSSPQNNAGGEVLGADPESWPDLLDDLELSLGEGVVFSPGDPHHIALTRPLARDLRVGLGDRVVLTLSDPQGEVVRALFFVGGLLDVGPAGIDRLGLLSLEAAQLAGGLGDAVTGIGVQLSEPGRRFALRDTVAQVVLAERPGASIEVLTWDEVLPELVAMLEVDHASTVVFLMVVFLIVVFAIANTMLMSVLERVREFGLLGAMGLRPSALLRLVFLEGLLMTSAFMLCGLVVALAAHVAIATFGIPVGDEGLAFETADVRIADTAVYSAIVVPHWAKASLMVFVLSMASSLYPAFRAMRLEPTEAMRTWK